MYFNLREDLLRDRVTAKARDKRSNDGYEQHFINVGLIIDQSYDDSMKRI